MIKRRKLAIVTFVLLAVMLVSVGFAAITGDLSLTLNASSVPQHFNVKFTNATATKIVDSQNDGAAVMVSVENVKLATEGTSTKLGPQIAGSEETAGVANITMNVENLAVITDYVTVDFTVKNFNNVDMQVGVNTPAMSIFTAEYGFVVSENLVKTIVIEAGTTATFRVTVKLASSAHATQNSEKIVFEFTGTSDIPTP